MIPWLSTAGEGRRRLVAVPVLLALLGSLLSPAASLAAPSRALIDSAPGTAAGASTDRSAATGPGALAIVAGATPTVIAIAAGDAHTCALIADGTVRCWGRNSAGQLGDGTTTNRSSPVQVSGITAATAIAAGYLDTCALLADRTVRCWGANSFGQLGDTTTTGRHTPVQVAGITSAVAIAAGGGYGHTCALLEDRTVSCWGNNTFGQLGDDTWANRPSPVTVHGISSATAIATGSDHSCALLDDGSARCWGYNGSGQLGDPDCFGLCTSSPVPRTVHDVGTATTVAAGDDHTCARLGDGTVRCWGDNLHGQLGDGTTTKGLAPVPVSGITNATAVAAGDDHTCARLGDGTVRCWGDNFYGQLGDGTTTDRTTSGEVTGIGTATVITAGDEHACARVADGSAWCWGRNTFGQLGDATTTDRLAPVAVVLPALDTTPPTAIMAAPSSPATTAILSYAVTFAEPVTGLEASDFTRTGSATGCTVDAPSGSAASYAVTVSGCSDGTVVLALGASTVADTAGNPGPPSDVAADAVIIDRTPPTATAPVATLRSGASLSGSALPVRLAWTGSDTGGTGIARYELARSANGGRTWTTVSASLTTPSTDVTVAASGTVQFRVLAVDAAGNTGAWVAGRSYTPRLVQQSSTSVRYAGAWASMSSAAYSGGSAKYAKLAGRSVTYTFTGRSIALVTTTSPTRGKVKVYVNGAYVATVNLYATTTRYRVLAWQKTWTSSGTRTVKLIVAGTSGRPRVDLDAFAVLK